MHKGHIEVHLITRVSRTAKIFLAVWLMVFTAGYGVCQSIARDGFHQEFDEDGQVRAEYFLKEGTWNGVYNKYDQGGQLEYQLYYLNGIYDGMDGESFYYPLFTWNHHIEGQAKEVRLSAAQALKKFGEEYILGDEPEGWDVIGVSRTRIPIGPVKDDRYPVTLTGISRDYLYLDEFKARQQPEGMEHQFYDLVRTYKVQRDSAVDRLFNAREIEEILNRRHTGIEFGTPFGTRKRQPGSRLLSVQQFIGDPDFVRRMPALGWFDVYYEEENLHLIGHEFSVYFMEERRPDWAAATPSGKTPHVF